MCRSETRPEGVGLGEEERKGKEEEEELAEDGGINGRTSAELVQNEIKHVEE